jgi:hypothetical protein
LSKTMAPDSSSTYSTTYTATITFGGWSNSTCDCSSNYSPKPTSVASMCRGFRRWLNDSEKAIMRALNLEPTVKGIESCLEKHRTLCRVVKSLPHFKSRLDRRIPCWRSTRWKSLT